MDASELTAAEVAERSLRIAARICIFTNEEIVVEELSE
jgi:ATP-dependent protease HslVU (ClpYQ) peptidase subunit